MLGDTADITNPPSSSAYWNAAVSQMEAAVGATNVEKIGGIDSTTLTAASLRQANGDPYDIIVMTAVFGGVSQANRDLIEQAIKNRTASAFFLFPDQCSSCAKNVDDISVPFVNHATGWSITVGSQEARTRAVHLNQITPLKASFVGLPSLYVNDYTDLYQVPKDNALYMREGAPPPVATDTLVNQVAAILVPRSQSYGGNGACIFVISDVNTLIDGDGNPVNQGLGTAMVNASAQSCSVDEGGIEITKTLSLPTGVTGPFDFKFEATCDKPSAGTLYTSPTLNYPTANKVVISYIPAGANCTVKEVLPTPPANYLWAPVADQTASAIVKDVNQPVTFINTLQPVPVGTLRITHALSAPASFTGAVAIGVTATCSLPAAGTVHGPFTLNAPADTFVDITGIPQGASCTVSQQLPGAPSGYAWGSSSIAPATITVAAASGSAVTINNALTSSTAAATAQPVPALGWLGLLGAGTALAASGAMVLRRRRV